MCIRDRSPEAEQRPDYDSVSLNRLKFLIKERNFSQLEDEILRSDVYKRQGLAVEAEAYQGKSPALLLNRTPPDGAV